MNATRFKNILWVLFAIVVLAVLYYLSRENEVIPHSTIPRDTTEIRTYGKGGDYWGGDPVMNYNPTSKKRAPREDFLGKKFSVCLEMIYEWPDAQVYDMGDGKGGMTFLDFTVNNHHHFLTFSENVCATDDIQAAK